jgi:hypothetical protein
MLVVKGGVEKGSFSRCFRGSGEFFHNIPSAASSFDFGVAMVAILRKLRDLANIDTPNLNLDGALGVFSELFLKSKNALHGEAPFSRRKRGFLVRVFAAGLFLMIISPQVI